MTSFRFSAASRRHLVGVDVGLHKLMDLSLAESPVDFAIVSGVRTYEEQFKLLQAGKTNTLDSHHMTGHAVDVQPFYQGQYVEAWPFFFVIADTVRRVSIRSGLVVTWGGIWIAPLAQYPSVSDGVGSYLAQCAIKKKKPFLDGPHFQVIREDHGD